MENLRNFLDSSSVHGLNYISTTRKYVRFFWILVVISGFTGAGFMIYESFQSWDESPIKTTIETRPITEITFPKVTVCPPKNIYTDLNYDLKMTENKNIENEQKKELSNYALELLYDQLFNNIIKNLSLLEDKDKYFNWYHGYNEIRFPVLNSIDTTCYNEIRTSSPSGEISTQYFGERFDTDKVQTDFVYRVFVIPPENVETDKNVSLHFNIENILMNDLSSGENKLYLPRAENMERRYIALNYTPPIDNPYSSSESVNKIRGDLKHHFFWRSRPVDPDVTYLLDS